MLIDRTALKQSWESMEYLAGVEEMARGSTDMTELQPACLRAQPPLDGASLSPYYPQGHGWCWEQSHGD